MGKLDLLDFKDAENNKCVERRYKFILTEEELTRVFELLSSDLDQNENLYLKYIYGYGGQPKSVYENLNRKNDDFELLWFGNNSPNLKGLKGFFIKVVSSIFASTYGLIKIKKSAITKDLLKTLSNLSMVGFFSLTKDNSDRFEHNFLNNLNNVNYTPEEDIKMDASFFYFIVDCGAYDNEGVGYLCQCAYGKDCAQEFLKIIDFTSKRW